MVVGVEGKNRDKSQRSMILRKIKDKTVSLELVNIIQYKRTGITSLSREITWILVISQKYPSKKMSEICSCIFFSEFKFNTLRYH